MRLRHANVEHASRATIVTGVSEAVVEDADESVAEGSEDLVEVALGSSVVVEGLGSRDWT